MRRRPPAPLPFPRLALVDLDGTLVDTVPDIAHCVDETLRALGEPPAGAARVRRWVGNGVERLVARALTGELEGNPPPERLARALERFRSLYAENVSTRSRVYPGVAEGLDYLARGGARLACVTNKPARFAEPLLADLGLRPRFELVLCGDTVARAKPDPAPFLHGIRRLGLDVEDTLAVGDSVNDVLAARAAGVAIVCVSYGYNHGLDIEEAGPDAIVDTLAELPGVLSAR